MKNKEVSTMFPLNLQYFADGGEGETKTGQDPEPKKEQPEQPKPEDADKQHPDVMTPEVMAAQLAQLKAENMRLKNDNDKLCSSEGQLRKQLRAKQTAEEQAAEAEAEAKRQQEEHTKAVEKELAIMKATNRYLELGLSKDEAGKVAADEVNGDMEAWQAGINSYLANAKKDAYAQARADLLKEMPTPQSGNSVEVDYTQKFNDAMNNGDTQNAVLALLEQSKANGASA